MKKRMLSMLLAVCMVAGMGLEPMAAYAAEKEKEKDVKVSEVQPESVDIPNVKIGGESTVMTLDTDYQLSLQQGASALFSFTPDESGAYVFSTDPLEGTQEVFVSRLLDSNKKVLNSYRCDEYSKTYMYYGLQAGTTYYLRVYAGNGNINGNVRVEKVPSIAMTKGQSYDISLADGEDVWYSFVPEQDGVYEFESTGDGDPYAKLYNDAFVRLKDDDDQGTGNNFYIAYSLEAGKTYYLKIEAYYRGFEGSVRVKDASLYKYEDLGDNQIAITCYNGNATSLEIPSQIDGKTVIYIGNYAFEYNDGLTDVTIPSTVKGIGNGAFYDCDFLKEVVLPEGIAEIGLSAFWSCNSLMNIAIPSSVTSIGSSAFGSCSSLMSIAIPSSVTYIGDSAFWYCYNLKAINVDSNNAVYTSEDGVLYDKEKRTLLSCPAGKESISIPESVTSIGNYAFRDCDGFSDIKLPSGVTSIGKYAFEDCSYLNNITIPSGVTRIEHGTFEYCGSLTGVSIPKGITSIGLGAFYECESLKDVYYGGTEADWKNVSFDVNKDEVEGDGNDYLRAATMHYGICAHKVLKDAGVPATCTVAGKTEGSHCSVCGAVITPQQTIPASGHTCKNTVTKATTKKNGTIVAKCTKCGETVSTQIIYAPKTIKLSKTSVTYTGKALKPSVSVKDSKGKKISSKYYTVSYKNNKSIGKATVTITFKGNYSGKVTKTFEIVPKSTSISKVTAKKKAFTVKWKKQTSQTSGYQIQYSKKSNFKGAKTVTVNKNKTTSKSITKLSGNKKYYVRVRTYKNVKMKGKTTKIYSAWSKTKSVKTKK